MTAIDLAALQMALAEGRTQATLAWLAAPTGSIDEAQHQTLMYLLHELTEYIAHMKE